MKLKENKIKKWILRLCLVLLCYPLFEFFTPLNLGGTINNGGLSNSVDSLSTSSFLEGDFQESFTNYINDQIGLFPFFVRNHNQIEYTLFDKVHTREVVTGKNNYLYEQPYIDTYFGKDFAGLGRIEKYAGVIKELQDKLAAKGKLLVYIMATGKASYYPEHLPYSAEKDSTIIKYLAREFDRKQVNYINTVPYFLEMKDTLGDLLFPKYGIHWSHFSNFFVADTLVKYVEEKTQWDLPNIHIQNYNYSATTKYFDNDLASALNLYQELEPDSMAYPDYYWDEPVGEKKKLLMVGDSFGWDLFENFKLGEDCFDEMQFWFYNQVVNTSVESEARDKDGLPLLTRHIDLDDAIEKFDVFLIISNEPHLAKRGWGFPKSAVSILNDPNTKVNERMNNYLKDQCYNKKAWRDGLQELAEERGKTFDEMVEIYLHDKEFKFD